MSSINPNNIDGQYPVAGQDNDSQGFRDNFTNIKNNFNFAATEINDLQSKTILKSALTGGTLNNDMQNTQLIGAQCLRFTETINDLSFQAGNVTLDWSTGHFQTFVTSGAITQTTLANWPASGTYAKMRILANVAVSSHSWSLPSSVSVGISAIPGSTTDANGISTISYVGTGAGQYLYEFSTYDGGTTVVINDLLQNYDNAVMQTLTVSGDTTINGNLTTAGARFDSGYQYLNPTTDFNTQINSTVARVIMDPAGTLANGTLTLPAGISNQVVQISSTQTITALKVKGSGADSVKPSANVTLTAGTGITFLYKANETTWYKIA